ncbi:hypothetical protein LENED_000753 [Lentinula edodes]|uniref:Uncharacterized protein n=1 Tax=Lentinula edodes TaxID=5353 RepID=A0A1Q3DX51_LENED|nr:hypothetical protein LENED_000753 [Lentinula edodes]
MGGFSPSTYLLWSILACLFEGFLVAHLYSYDKFQCVKWGSGRQPGAFKRIMTYSKVWSIPFSSWTHTARKRLLPLFFVLASAWALELVTHLEELTFWLFLLHQGPHKRDWFKSWEFRVWYLGSVIAILGMPLTVIIKRANLDLCFAWIFLAGSAAGLATTLCFMYVLVRFPGFIRRVKFEGAEPEVVVRLTIFYQLNITRMIFRFMFHFPLLILALDAVQGPHDIIAKQAASDLLVMLGGIGCFVSSAITLFIVRAPSLPDYHREQNMSHPKPTPPAADTFHHFENHEDLAVENLSQNPEYDGEATPQYESDPESDFIDPATVQGRNWIADTNDDATTWEMHSNEIFRTGSVTYHRPRIHQSRHGRRRDIEEQPSIGNIRAEINKYSTPPGSGKDPSAAVIVVPRISRVDPTRPLVMEEPSASHSSDVVHPYAMNFTSPIDLCDASLPRAI